MASHQRYVTSQRLRDALRGRDFGPVAALRRPFGATWYRRQKIAGSKGEVWTMRSKRTDHIHGKSERRACRRVMVRVARLPSDKFFYLMLIRVDFRSVDQGKRSLL